MGLFTSDLFRNIGIGFAIGAVLIGVSAVPQWTSDLASPALAATSAQEPGPSTE